MLAGALLTAALAGGCASVTFKRGASPGAMTADEQACGGREAADAAAFRQCMQDRGWFVAGQAGESVSGGTVDTPAAEWLEQQREQSATPVAAAPVATARAAPADAPAAVVSVTAVAADAPTAASPAISAARAAVPVAAPAPAATPFDPLAVKKVTSWWKLGGSAAAFDGAVDVCVAELGVAHRPDPPATTVTAGLNACLRAAGWYGM